MLRKFRNTPRRAFALPTILLASTLLMIVLVVSASAATSISKSLNNQYYSQLAREAAQSALIRAEACMTDNNNQVPSGVTTIVSWASNCNAAPSGDSDGHLEDPSGGTSPANYAATGIVYDQRNNILTQGVATYSASNTIQAYGYLKQLRSNGTVWNTVTARLSIHVSSLVSARSLTFGYDGNSESGAGAFFATIGNDGVARTVGVNTYGQLGDGTTSPHLTPTKIDLPPGEYAKSIYTSFVSVGYNMFVLTQSGKIYGSGYNSQGQLGNRTAPLGNVLTSVQFQLPANDNVATYVAVLGFTTYVLTSQNNLYAAGDCTDGLLGDGQTTTTSCVNQSTPVKVLLPAGEIPTTNIALDHSNVYVRMTDGKVYGWGRNTFGELANNTTTSSSIPIQIGTFGNSSSFKAVQVAFDGDTVYIVTNTGTVMEAGNGAYGQLGFMPTTTCGGTPCQQTLVYVTNTTPPWGSAKIIKVWTDQWSLILLDSIGRVWGCGINNVGQLGNGNTTNQTTPVQFGNAALQAGEKYVDIYNSSTYPSPNYNDTYAVTNLGRVFGAGSNTYGQLGIGSEAGAVSTPVAMHVFDGTTIKASDAKTGFGTTVITTTQGQIYTVGHNNDGQLGDGTTNDSAEPMANHYVNAVPTTLY